MRALKIILTVLIVTCLVILSVLAIGFLLNGGFDILKNAWVEYDGFTGFFRWFFTKFMIGQM